MKHILALLGVLATLSAYSHASHRMHEADIFAVFDGCDSPLFRRMAKRISSDMDNELPRRFREEIGSVPGNHRILGHCWTFGDAIPRRVLDAIEGRHPGRKSDFVALWQTFANEIIDDVSQTTRLPRKQAGALAALIHDVHLLGDRTPDNVLVDYVLTTDEIRRNIVKSAGIIWGRASQVTRHLEDAGKTAYANGYDEFTRAEGLLSMMKSVGLGYALSLLLKGDDVSHDKNKSSVLVDLFDTPSGGLVKYWSPWARVFGQDIVRELIGRVKLLRVSRRTISTPGCNNAAKAVATRNLGTFKKSDILQGKRSMRLPLFVFSYGFLKPRVEYEGRSSFVLIA